MTQANKTSNRTIGFAACTVASMFWGCGFFFGKIALAEMNVGTMVFYRWLFAMLALSPVLFMHRPRFTAREWLLLAFSWTMGVPVQYLLQFKGLSLTTVSHAALMVGTMPVLLALGATIFAHERLHTWGWAAIAASTCGAALIVLGKSSGAAHGNAPSLAGDMFVVLSLLLALFWVLINKSMMEQHGALTVTAWGGLVGTVVLAIASTSMYGLPTIHGISTKAWMASAASGFLCTAAATLLWNWGLMQVPASQAGVLLNMEPLIGSMLGVLVLGEHLGTLAYIGGALIVVAAITLTVTSPRTAEAVSAEI